MQINELAMALKILRSAGEGLEVDMTLSLAYVFLHVAQRPGVPQRELETLTGLLRPNLSRIVQTLGEGRKREGKRADGLKLVKVVPSQSDFRANDVYLTERGEKILKNIKEI